MGIAQSTQAQACQRLGHDMKLRAVAPSDAHQMARLWHENAMESVAINPRFRPRISVDAYAARVEAELASREIIGWGVVTQPDDALVAYLTAEIVAPSAKWEQDGFLSVLDVDVRSTERRRGHATSLLRLAIGHARTLGLKRVELSWLASDACSSAVWSKLGFRPYLHSGYLDLPPTSEGRA